MMGNVSVMVLENNGSTHLQSTNLTIIATSDADPNSPSAASAIILLYSILLLMIGAQAGLYWFRNKHKRAYDLATLFGLWLMPPIFCIQLHYWRFIMVWFCYSCATAYLMSLCLNKKLALSTPRRVYLFFLIVYRVSRAMGLAGYTLLLINAVNGGAVGAVFHLPKDAFLDLLWYGLYFGVLGRDCAEVASDSMASAMGTQGRRLLTQVNKCGVCGNELQDGLHGGVVGEPVIQLQCKHSFHELCIRGWTVVGKKDTCPTCCEKVDFAQMNKGRPWITRNQTWIQMLDSLRYLIVWNPIIFLILNLAVHIFEWHPHHHLGGLHGLHGGGALPLANSTHMSDMNSTSAVLLA